MYLMFSNIQNLLMLSGYYGQDQSRSKSGAWPLLSFCIAGVAVPPSLVNIYKELFLGVTRLN